MIPIPVLRMTRVFGQLTLLSSIVTPPSNSSNLLLTGGRAMVSPAISSPLAYLPPYWVACLLRMNEWASAAVYLTLHYQYGAGDYSAVMVIEARLRNLKCLPTRGGVRLTDFITTWRTSLNQMDAAGYPPSPLQILTIFADGLPQHSVAFVNLYDYIILSLNEPNEQMLPNIHQLFNRAINLDNNLQRTRLLNPRCLPLSAPAASSSSTPTLVPPAPSNSLPSATGTRSNRRCSNCGREGHTDDTCFQPGGAMEGRREEYLASCPPRVAHIAEVEENQLDIDEGTTVFEDTTLTTEFAALSLTTSNEISFSTYAYSCISEILHDQPIALHALSATFNTALDSACTNHIFHDRNLFHTYDVAGAVSVKTANCGTLATLAIGDIKIKLMIDGKTIIWTLRNCLHAPTVPINLISVGALQEHHMSVVFSFQKTTISFPSAHPQLSGLSFNAHVTQCLSLLNLEFVDPPLLPVALHLFPVTPPSPDTWHRRFGHLGHEASRNVLIGNYATGIIKPSLPYPTSSRCIPCLIGKSPQTPYAHNTKRASSVCELIHINTCGPFPTLTPRKEAYFIIFLDDKSNYGVTSLLTTKNGAFPAWKRVEAAWELISGNRVKAVRLPVDGAKEFVQGPLLNHFQSRGISIVKTLNPERGKIRSTERNYTGARRNRTQGHKECYNVGSGLGFNLCVAPSS